MNFYREDLPPMALYVFGSNELGQLGLGDNLMSASKPRELKFFRDKQVVKIATGKLHTLVLCADNSLYSWGLNDDGALGREGPESTPALVQFKQKIHDICAGASFSAILSARGRVFGCGTFKSTSGILGFQPGIRVQETFKLVTGTRAISQVRAGHNHLIMVGRKGSLAVLGANESMQLGIRQRERRADKSLEVTHLVSYSKHKATADNTIVDAGAGGFHSIAISASGAGLGWGSNFNGQLGDGSTEPQLFPANNIVANIAKVSCGLTHTLLLTRDGKVYGCGNNTASQLGLQENKIVSVPCLITENASDIACGAEFSVIQKDSRLLSCGLNFFGEAGHENHKIESLEEIPFNFGEIQQISCGSHFTVVLTK